MGKPPPSRPARAYCVCDHWESNHDGACLLCPCERYEPAPTEKATALPVFWGPRATFRNRKALGAGPEA